MAPAPTHDPDDALSALQRQRQIARKWGLFALCAALIVGAVIAPRATLLAFVALVVFGTLGVAIAWALRKIDLLFSSTRN